MISISTKETKNLKEKVIGLIGKDKAYGLMLKTRFGIHTFGLKFPIDVIILDKNNRVAKLKKSLKPNRIFLWNPLYDRILELPPGTITKKGLKLQAPIDLKIL